MPPKSAPPAKGAAVQGRAESAGLLESSKAMRPVLDLARRVASTRASVLIFGESGTGKELLARLIHDLGSRREHPFVRIPCANLPEDLLESELFGAERGAFSGAADRKIGRMEQAHGGTVYFDEILALSPAVQAKLLRLVQERTFERLGGQQTIHVDLRFIASTSLPPEEAASDERLRRDLYYRLNVVSLRLPPLRERREDILRLAEHFLNGARASAAHPVGRLTPAAKRALLEHRWPGNVRELKNAIERAAILASERDVEPEDLGIDPAAAVSGLLEQAVDRGLTINELEKAYIEQVLGRAGGNKSRAARILGISRKTLLDKRRRYGLD